MIRTWFFVVLALLILGLLFFTDSKYETPSEPKKTQPTRVEEALNYPVDSNAERPAEVKAFDPTSSPSQDPSPKIEKYLVIEGRVSDRQDVPIEDVSLQLFHGGAMLAQESSDQRGHYSFKMPWEEIQLPLQLEASSDRFVRRRFFLVHASTFDERQKFASTSTPVRILQEYVRLDLNLDRSVVIRGRILFVSGEPAVQSKLSFATRDYWNDHGDALLNDRGTFLVNMWKDLHLFPLGEVTHEDGTFEVHGAPAGESFYCLITHPFAVPYLEPIAPIAVDASAELEVRLQPGSLIRGRVVNKNGEALKEVALRFSFGKAQSVPGPPILDKKGRDVRRREEDRHVKSGMEGEFEVPSVIPGSKGWVELRGLGFTAGMIYLPELKVGENRFDFIVDPDSPPGVRLQ